MSKAVKSKSPGRPKTRTHVPPKAAANTTKAGEERYIFIGKSESIQAMKDIAYWERQNIKDVYEEAIQDRKVKYEKKNGPLRPGPKRAGV